MSSNDKVLNKLKKFMAVIWLWQQTDGRVIENIKNLAEDGVTNVSEVQRRCEEFT